MRMPQKGRAKGGNAKISAVDEDEQRGAEETWQLSPRAQCAARWSQRQGG